MSQEITDADFLKRVRTIETKTAEDVARLKRIALDAVNHDKVFALVLLTDLDWLSKDNAQSEAAALLAQAPAIAALKPKSSQSWENPPWALRAILVALQRSEHADYDHVITTWSKDKSWVFRDAVALHDTQGEALVPMMRKLANDRNEEVQSSAFVTLGRMYTYQGRPALHAYIECLELGGSEQFMYRCLDATRWFGVAEKLKVEESFIEKLERHSELGQKYAKIIRVEQRLHKEDLAAKAAAAT